MTDEEIRNLSPEDMEKIQRKQQLMKEAEEYLFDIRDRYVFRMGEEWRIVLAKGDGFWVLYHNCTLKYFRHTRPGQKEELAIKLDTENIYKFLLAYDSGTGDLTPILAAEFVDFLKHTRKLPVYKVPQVNQFGDSLARTVFKG